jgi:hypothetical protein
MVRTRKSSTASLILFAAAFVSIAAMTVGAFGNPGREADMTTLETTHPYVGMWVTEDGRIRHELLPNGRYDEARGNRESAYQGQYWIEGNRIEYLDDTGFRADGEFRDGVLYHAGMVMRRK